MILMIHGMGATSSFWSNYSRFFRDRGYSTRAVTLLHHGEAEWRLRHIGVMDYVEQVEAEISEMPEKPIIIGHSMGGLIAQKLAERGHAEKLVLLAPAAPGGIFVVAPSVLITFLRNICDVAFKKPFIIPFWNACYGLMNTMTRGEQVQAYREFVSESGLAAHEISRGMINVEERRVTCPVVIVGGSQDRVTPPKIARRIAGKYHAQYLEYSGHCHHSLVIGSGWEEIANDIVEWLKRDE